MTLDLYQNYLKEREGKELFSAAAGFVAYQIIEPGIVYISDIYILPQMRQEHYATKLADRVVEITKAKVVLGTVDPNTNGAHESLLVLLAYGMKLWKYENNLIVFRKEVG